MAESAIDPGTDVDATPILRIAQLNIGSLFEAHWDQRRHEIVSWIDHLQPDVVCMQEAHESDTQPNTAGLLAEAAAGDWHWQFGGHAVPETSWPDRSMLFGSAVLSRWPIEASALHLLPLATGSATKPAMRMPCELLHVSTAGLDVFSTHLSAAPADAPHRVAQVQAIDDIIRASRGDRDNMMNPKREAMPPLLCGDFNAEPDSDEIRFLSSLHTIDGRATFYQDAWRVAGDGSAGYTSDWRDNELSSHLNIHRKRIDYVFVGDPFIRNSHGGRVLSAEVVFHEPRTGIVASDHRGLVANIVWPNRPKP